MYWYCVEYEIKGEVRDEGWKLGLKGWDWYWVGLGVGRVGKFCW